VDAREVEDLFISWWIQERSNTPTVKGITSMDWKDSGDTGKGNLHPREREEPTEEVASLSRWICVAIQPPRGKQYDEDKMISQTVRKGGWGLDCY
jgi:hypothetical protein